MKKKGLGINGKCGPRNLLENICQLSWLIRERPNSKRTLAWIREKERQEEALRRQQRLYDRDVYFFSKEE